MPSGTRSGRRSAYCGLQNRAPDCVSQCYFSFYDDPQERLGAALTHIGTTDPALANLLAIWSGLRPRVRKALVALARMATRQEDS